MHLPLRLLSTILVSVLMAIGIVFNAVIADTVTVWKWIDAEGKVVYSQHPPPGKVKAEEKHIDPNRNVIESGWPPPRLAVSARGSASSSEESSARRSRSRWIARQGGGAATEEPPVPPAVTPSPAVPSPPPTLTPPPVAPPAAPAVPSPGPGGF